MYVNFAHFNTHPANRKWEIRTLHVSQKPVYDYELTKFLGKKVHTAGMCNVYQERAAG